MAGAKSITLFNKQGRPIDRNFRYKKLRSAVRKATALSISYHSHIIIWDLARGKELAVVFRYKSEVRIQIIAPRIFDTLWAES